MTIDRFLLKVNSTRYTLYLMCSCVAAASNNDLIKSCLELGIIQQVRGTNSI